MVKNKKYTSCMRTKIVLVSVGVFLIGFAVVFFFAVQRQYHSGLENGKGVGQGIESPIGKGDGVSLLPQENVPTQGVENGSEGRVVGGDRDEHGCLVAAGYTWCGEQERCIRLWKELCGESEKKSCGIESCHGLDIVCVPNPPETCTMMYQLGDKCRQYVSCEKVDGTCRQKANPKFDACKTCVQDCEKKYPNDPSQVFTCEASCK